MSGWHVTVIERCQESKRRGPAVGRSHGSGNRRKVIRRCRVAMGRGLLTNVTNSQTRWECIMGSSQFYSPNVSTRNGPQDLRSTKHKTGSTGVVSYLESPSAPEVDPWRWTNRYRHNATTPRHPLSSRNFTSVITSITVRIQFDSHPPRSEMLSVA